MQSSRNAVTYRNEYVNLVPKDTHDDRLLLKKKITFLTVSNVRGVEKCEIQSWERLSTKERDRIMKYCPHA